MIRSTPKFPCEAAETNMLALHVPIQGSFIHKNQKAEKTMHFVFLQQRGAKEAGKQCVQADGWIWEHCAKWKELDTKEEFFNEKYPE